MKKILISICIPVYNDIKHIGQALQSCISQLQDDVEIVVLDNCSTDGTFQHAKTFETKNVKVFKNNVNLGAYGNHNELLNISNGRYIKFLHSDDILEDGAVAMLKQKIESEPQIDLFAFNSNYISNKNIKTQRKEFTKNITLKNLTANKFVKFGSFIGTPSMTMFKRSIIEKIGNFDSSMEPSSDTEFWDRVLEHCTVMLCTEFLVSVRDDPISKLQSYKLNKKFYKALLLRLNKLESRNGDNETLKQITQYKFRMLLVHLYLAIKLSIINIKFYYFFSVCIEIFITIFKYKFILKGKIRDLSPRLSKFWYQELIGYDCS